MTERARLVAATLVTLPKAAGLRFLSAQRRFPGLPADQQEHFLQHEIDRSLAADGAAIGVHTESGRIVALVALRPLDWDTRHFKRPMASLVIALAPDLPARQAAAAVGCALDRLRDHHALSHLVVEVDIDDYPALAALTANGFFQVDLKRSYYCRKFAPSRGLIRHQQSVRPATADDADVIDRLMACTEFPSRFSRDASFSADDVNALYRSWMASLIELPDTERLVRVYESRGRVVAAGAIGRISLPQALGSRSFFSGGLYASDGKHAGAYIPVMNALIRTAIERDGEVQTTVSLNNHAACRVIDGFASYHHVSMRHVLHWHSPEAGMGH